MNSKRKLDILTENFVPTLTLHDQEEKVSLEETTFSKSTGEEHSICESVHILAKLRYLS